MCSVRHTCGSKAILAYVELIPNFLSCIDFWEKGSDGFLIADYFDIRMVDRLPTQVNK